ncbi:hypothetical protein pb186bvf_003400 [Paramecium bursaria]
MKKSKDFLQTNRQSVLIILKGIIEIVKDQRPITIKLVYTNFYNVRDQIKEMKLNNQTLQEDLKQEYKFTELNRMEVIQEESTAFAKKIEIESKKQRDLEQLIALAEQQLYDHRKKMSTSDGVQLPNLIKKQKTFESQLEQIKLKHNESLAEINQLMEQINIARRERVIFSNVFKKLESDIRAKEEEFKRQLLIRKQKEVELAQYQDQFDKMKEQADKVLRNNHQEYISMIKTTRPDDDILIDIEQQPQPKIQPTQSNIGKPANQIQKAVDDAQQYEYMFDKLKKETGLNSIEEIVKQFKTIEEENNKLYRRANELSDQIDSQEREIEQIKEQIKNYSKFQKDVDSELEEEKMLFAQQLEKSQMLDQDIQKGEKEIQDFQNLLNELAKNLQIPVNGKNEANLMQLIEKRAYDLVDLTNHFQNNKINIDQRNRENESVKTQDDQQIKDLLDGVQSEKEAEKILTQNDFKDQGMIYFKKQQLKKGKKDI